MSVIILSLNVNFYIEPPCFIQQLFHREVFVLGCVFQFFADHQRTDFLPESPAKLPFEILVAVAYHALQHEISGVYLKHAVAVDQRR